MQEPWPNDDYTYDEIIEEEHDRIIQDISFTNERNSEEDQEMEINATLSTSAQTLGTGTLGPGEIMNAKNPPAFDGRMRRQTLQEDVHLSTSWAIPGQKNCLANLASVSAALLCAPNASLS